MTKFKLRKKRQKKGLRIISKPHSYLQTMTKTSVKFGKNQHKLQEKLHTQGTYYIMGGGRTDGMPKTMSLRFSWKRRGTKIMGGNYFPAKF